MMTPCPRDLEYLNCFNQWLIVIEVQEDLDQFYWEVRCDEIGDSVSHFGDFTKDGEIRIETVV